MFTKDILDQERYEISRSYLYGVQCIFLCQEDVKYFADHELIEFYADLTTSPQHRFTYFLSLML